MDIRIKNLVLVAAWGIVYYFYFAYLAEFLEDVTGIDPAVLNVMIAPVLLGALAFATLGGSGLQRIWFFVVIPIVPCLILGQEGDPAMPGIQWLVLAILQLPFWLGGGLSWAVLAVVGRRQPP